MRQNVKKMENKIVFHPKIYLTFTVERPLTHILKTLSLGTTAKNRLSNWWLCCNFSCPNVFYLSWQPKWLQLAAPYMNTEWVLKHFLVFSERRHRQYRARAVWDINLDAKNERVSLGLMPNQLSQEGTESSLIL